MFITALFTIARTWKQPRCPLVDERVRKLWYTVRMAAIQKSTNNKCWRGCGEEGTLLHCWWECKLVQPLWRTVWRFLKKLEIELPYDPEIPLHTHQGNQN